MISWTEGAKPIKAIIAWNDSLAAIFPAFIPPKLSSAAPPDEEIKVATWEGLVEGREGFTLRKNGSRFWASVATTALHDEDGKLLGFTKVTRDITEQKRVRESFLLAKTTNALLSNLDITKLLSAIGACVRQVKSI